MIGMVAVLLTGCTQGEKPPEGTVATLAAQPMPPIADVPLPEGFKLDAGKSWSWVGASQRAVHHLYEGKVDKFATIGFFKQQMPAAKWNMTRDDFTRGTAYMEFEKNGERCIVQISKGTWFLEPTEVLVMLEPAGGARTPTPATPK